MALAKSGHASISSALTMVDIFRDETECKCFGSRSMFVLLTWLGSLGLGQCRRELGSLSVDVVGTQGDGQGFE